MLDIAFKDFKAKKGRAAMCIIGVMACVMLIGVVNIVMYEMQTSLKGDLGTVGDKILFEQNGTGYPPAGSIIPETLGDEVLKRGEVNAAESTKLLFAPLQGGATPDGVPNMVVGIETGKEHVLIGDYSVDGAKSLKGQPENAVIMGSEAASNHNVSVGDTFTVNDNEFKVVGVIEKVGEGWPLTIDNSLIMSIPYAQEVTDRPGIISTVMIKPNEGYTNQAVEDNLEAAYTKYDIYTEKDVQKTIDTNLKGVMTFMNMVIVMIFGVSMVLIMNVMMMSVKEKTKEIGTMRAIGTRKRSILSLIIYESLILSSIGGIIGILLIPPTYSALGLMMGFTEVSFTLPTTVLVQVALIVLVIGTFSGLIPAYQATRISPIEALRYE
jgi:putative ABC transport system permease protein